jgi:membrane protease YdiL (CAAX protease family)
MFGAAMLLFVYFGAGWLQSGRHFSRELGLVLTLWGVVLWPAVLYPLLTRQPLRELLALKRTRPSNLVLAALAGPAAAVLIGAYMELQQLFLPLPEELERFFSGLFKDLGPLPAFLLFALSPGICEELLWRGAFQGELEARGRKLRAAILVGVFFGLFHMSAYRFLPTAALGALLAGLRLRTGSIYPCMILHTGYNATVLLVLSELVFERGNRISDMPLLLVAAILVLAASWRWLRR